MSKFSAFGENTQTKGSAYNYRRHISTPSFSIVIQREKCETMFKCDISLRVPIEGTMHKSLVRLSSGAGESPRVALDAAAFNLRTTAKTLVALNLSAPKERMLEVYKPFMLR